METIKLKSSPGSKNQRISGNQPKNIMLNHIFVTKSGTFSMEFLDRGTKPYGFKGIERAVQKLGFLSFRVMYLPLPHHYGRKSIRQQNVQSTLLKLTFNSQTIWPFSPTQTSAKGLPNCPNMANPTPNPPKKNIFYQHLF